MHKLRRTAGFSLMELMVVIAIIAIVSALVVPALQSYGLRESARANAQNLAAILAETRGRAIDQGTNYLVFFANPLTLRNPFGPTPPIAQIVQDVDGDWLNSPGDVVQNVFAYQDTRAAVSVYGVGGAPPFGTAPLSPEDFSGTAIPDLASLANGTTFPTFAGAPALGFTPRGVPVDLNNPNNPGSGAGAVYLTDNNKTVYATVLLPLGGVRVRVLDPNLNNWL